ncbi:MAG TPA: hypothetical protein VFW11_23215 [Cyclobacteriaceae bacterium]|nr:hypothetical protein [Cyclobacteriaceae bacterium]
MLKLLFPPKNRVFDRDGSWRQYKSQDLDINFTKSAVDFPLKPPKFAPALAAMLPSAVDIIFQLTGKALESNEKKFVAEYTLAKSNLNAGNTNVPNLFLVRSVSFDGKTEENGLAISFAPEKVSSMDGFIYYVNAINLTYSSAKCSGRHPMLDYTLEIKLTYWIDGERKLQELLPISISSVKFGTNIYNDKKHRTDIIPLTPGALLTEVAIKVVESSPEKIKAEKILALWNDNKDSAKTIINNILPKEK